MPINNDSISGVYGKGDVFIQYKGTDICADVVCPKCGENEHIDGDFAYGWECPNCKTKYALSSHIKLFKLKEPK
jgi:ribosomal protein L37AE/L43A